MTILISIISYREKELLHTVRSFYEDADNKEALLFSIVSQDEKHPNLDFIDKKNIRYIKIDWQETYGSSWARSIAQRAFSQFDYYLQLDSHMFSEQGWDTKLISVFNEAKLLYDKPVLTCYPAMYRIENEERILGPVTTNQSSDIYGGKCEKGSWPTKVERPHLSACNYLQGAALFSDRSFVDQVPYDPGVHFYHEELILTMRAESKGFTAVHISTPLFFHFYYQDREKAGRIFSPLIPDEQHKNLDVIDDGDYPKRLLRGEVSGVYGLSIEEIKRFCDKYKYKIDKP